MTAVAQAPRPATAPAAVPNAATPNAAAQAAAAATPAAATPAAATPAAAAPKPAGAAPAAATTPATKPATAAPTAAQPTATQAAQTGATATNANGTSPIALREAPAGTNPVLAAFTPQPGGLTANDVAERAVATSDTIAARNAELRAAAAAVDSAMYQFYPRLALKASYMRMSPVHVSLGGGYSMGAANQADPQQGQFIRARADGVVVDPQGVPIAAQPFSIPIKNDFYSLGASLSVPVSDYVLRLSSSIDATKKNQEASELNLKAERQKVEADARLAFYNWTMAIGQVAVTEKSLERMKARLKDAQTAFTLGAATKADVLRLQALVASTEAGLTAAQSFKALAEEQLATIMNTKPEAYPLGEDVLADKNVVPLQPLEDLVHQANANRYELKALDKNAQSMLSAETVLRRGQLPRLDGVADYTYANPNQRYLFVYEWRQTWSLGVAATWNINEIFTNGSSANEMVARRQAVEANRRAMAKGIRIEVASAYQEARRTQAELEAAKRAAEAAQAAYDTEVELFKVGKATTTELIDAEGELVNSLLKLISAHIGTRVAETRIARSTGRDMHTLAQ
jgi:outer membrane protein TolC